MWKMVTAGKILTATTTKKLSDANSCNDPLPHAIPYTYEDSFLISHIFQIKTFQSRRWMSRFTKLSKKNVGTCMTMYKHIYDTAFSFPSQGVALLQEWSNKWVVKHAAWQVAKKPRLNCKSTFHPTHTRHLGVALYLLYFLSFPRNV